MNDKEFRALRVLSDGNSHESSQLAKLSGIEAHALSSAAESLHTQGLANKHVVAEKFLIVSEKGIQYEKVGLPETRLLNAVGKHRLLSEAVKFSGLNAQEANVALGQSVKSGLVERSNSPQGLMLVAKASHNPAEQLFSRVAKEKSISETHLDPTLRHLADSLVSRGILEIREHKTASYSITTQGRHELKSEETGGGSITQLTPAMLTDGSWKDSRFRPYDLSTVAAPMQGLVRKHAYKEFLNRIKMRLVGMGFQEVHGPLVELEFWNMDALFMAQDHPAREIHDVFRIKHERGGTVPEEFAARVKSAHENGVEGGRGWGYSWDPRISAQLVLRSQTTAVSARNLAKGLEVPARVFCIGKVFRPDEINWSHFIEFNQCEGIVVDEGLPFRELLGYLKTFAQEVFGAKKVKFAPNYFPFTEPSVEMYVDIPGKGWAEVGGAGMFRPEMLHALKVDHPVAAWGLGIDRLAMLSLDTKDIRDLHSHDLGFLKSH